MLRGDVVHVVWREWWQHVAYLGVSRAHARSALMILILSRSQMDYDDYPIAPSSTVDGAVASQFSAQEWMPQMSDWQIDLDSVRCCHKS